MSLSRQLLFSFVVVAVLPLIAISCYLYQINIRLAFDLYKQNLFNSTEIQTDVVDEHIRQFMIQAERFASSKALQNFLLSENAETADMLTDEGMSEEIFKFTDNTLDSVITFSIIDSSNRVLYRSGSNGDSKRLEEALKHIPQIQSQSIFEVPWGEAEDSLIIVTPISRKATEEFQGLFVSVYSNDYFLKTISSHKQIESSNSFIFCTEHKTPVKTKQQISGSMGEFSKESAGLEEGVLVCMVGDVKSLASYKRVSKTPWLLVNSIPASHVYSFVLSYGLVNILVFIVCLVIIIILSRRQSKRILLPLNQLLKNVESFFVLGTKVIAPLSCSKKTEIGYLGEKFTNMSVDIAAAQDKLNESNYLYEALMDATYDLSLSFHFENQCITSSSTELQNWLNSLEGLSASEKLIRFFETTDSNDRTNTLESINHILEQKINKPAEIEAFFNTTPQIAECWYRIIAVPIINESKCVTKVVFHFENITFKKHEQLRLLESSQRDALCGLLNKQALLSLAQKHTIGFGSENVVFFIDLDHFKNVNDTLGHLAGDGVLIKVSRILTAQFRSTDLVARYGGDEFVVFVSGISRDTIENKVDTLLKELSITLEVEGGDPIHVTASIGVYISSGTQDPETMLKYADKAMYIAKQRGKFQCCILEEGQV